MRRKKLNVIRRPGCKDWYIRPRINGKSEWIRLSDNKSESERLARNYERNRMLKRVEGFNPHAEISLVAERYLRDKRVTLTTKKSIQRYEVVVRRFQEFLARYAIRNVSEVKPEMISDYLNWREEEVSDRTWNIERIVLSNFFKFCMNHEWVLKNPVKKIPMKNVITSEPDHLNEVEASKLLGYMKGKCYDVPYYELVATLLHTGMRLNEACYLTKEDIDLKRWQIVVREKEIDGKVWAAKTKERRYIPIPLEIRGIVRQLMNAPGEFLFQNTNSRPMKDRKVLERLQVACKKAGVKKVHVHSLRHTFTSMSMEKGVDPRITQKILGHKSSAMTDRYTHMRPEFLGKVMESFGYTQPIANEEKSPEEV